MNYIFYGFLVFAIGGYKFGVVDLGPLVNIAAYFLIYKGITVLDRENVYFKKAMTWIYVLMGINGLSFFVSFLNVFFIGLLIGLVTFVFDILVIYNVIKGIQTYSDRLTDKKLPARLFKNWLIKTVLMTIILIVVGIAFISVVKTISLEVLRSLISTFRAADPNTYGAIVMDNLEVLQSIIPIFVFGGLLVAGLGIAAFIFEILFLVSMFKIQDEYQRNKALEAFNAMNSEEPKDLQ